MVLVVNDDMPFGDSVDDQNMQNEQNFLKKISDYVPSVRVRIRISITISISISIRESESKSQSQRVKVRESVSESQS